MDTERSSRPTNWFAHAALWSALATWLTLIGSLVVAEVVDGGSIFDVTGWVALGFATLALVLGVAGVSVVRDRGEAVVAIIALVLVLALATFASPLFLFGFGSGFD